MNEFSIIKKYLRSLTKKNDGSLSLSDDVFYAHIPLLEVLPKYQGYGIGTALVKRMLDTLDNMYAIDIICDETLVPFYKGLGLKKSVGMVVRNYKSQSAVL